MGDAVVAVSVATLLLVEVWFELLFMPESSTYYLGSPRTAADYGASLLAVLVLASVLLAGGRLARKPAFRRFRFFANALSVAVVLLPLNAIRLEVRLPMGAGRAWHLVEQHGLVVPLAVTALGLLVLAARFHWQVGRGIYVLLLVASPFAFVTLGRVAVRLVTGFQDRFEVARAAANVGAALGERKVVWIVFDELDEGVLAGARPAGLELPEFDRLRRESFVATHALPPSDSTLVSMPSLWAGRPVTSAEPRGPSALHLRFEDGAPEALWGDVPNVFCSAHGEGFRTVMAGWYHPYCRQFGPCFDECHAEPVFLTALGRAADRPLVSRVGDQLLTALPINRRRLALGSYEALFAEARTLLVNPRPGLVFIHLPVPHVPAIYDRQDGRLSLTRFSNLDGYLDNVALADRTFGELRRVLEASGQWKDATVLVSADHGWRERAAFDGVRHREVPFLLKLAGDQPATVYDKPFRSVVTGELLAAILRGAISRPEEVTAALEGAAKGSAGQLPR